MKKYTIAFDLDNTICDSIRENHPEDIPFVKPRKNIVKIIKDLKKKGNSIIIFTRRGHLRNARKMTIEWLKHNEVPYDTLITRKPHYDLFIDDRALPVYSCSSAKNVEKIAGLVREDMQKTRYLEDE